MTYPITGIRTGWGPNGEVPARREIDEWYTSSNPTDKDQVNLYLQALINFQNIPADEKLSFFQVAGIHGQPLVPWDEDTTSKTPGRGYCTHDSILFPTWHRPYMLLYEQRIYEEMKNLVSGYPQSDQARLNAACDSWRLPYWDWAAKKPQPSGGPNYSVPQIVTLPTVDVYPPSGGVQNVPNPMYKFTMPGGQSMGQQGIGKPSLGIPFETTKGTSRWSPSTDDDGWVEGVENNDGITATLRDPNSDPGDWTQALGTIADAVYRLFTAEYMTNYEAFATAKFGPSQPPQDYISLEDVHNAIHDMSGGFSANANGHMAAVPVAAFDPIFWLHHCNVDRYLAIFLALRENDWFDNPDQALTDDGTWSIAPNSIDTPQTDLAPFHNENGGYFKSDDVRQTFQLGYTYPELQPWDPKNQTNGQFDPVKYKRNINEQLTQLYDNHTQWALRTESKAVKHEPTKPASAKAAQQPLAQVAPDAKATHDDYFVNVLYDKFALGGHPFKIHIYFGTKSVGGVFNFSTPANTIGRDQETGCINCHRQEANRIRVTGQVPITNALREAPDVEVTDRESVLTYLKEKLNWAVTAYYGERVPPENVGQFVTVSVARGRGTHYADDCQLSEYYDYEYLPHVTDGKHGGLRA